MSEHAPSSPVVEAPEGRYALRALNAADAGWIVRACADPEIQRWTRVPEAYSEADAHEFISTLAGSLEVWAVVDAVAGDGLGTVAVHRIVGGEAQLGYWIAPWARRKGAATWATLAVCERLSDLVGVVQASLDIADTNAASRRVACRAGFRAGFRAGPTPAGLTVTDGCGMSPATRFIRSLPKIEHTSKATA
jgi:RimJ/RimL family protein N-acetyltransferase